MSIALQAGSFLAMTVAAALVFALVKNLPPRETAREFLILLGKLLGGFILLGGVAHLLCR